MKNMADPAKHALLDFTIATKGLAPYSNVYHATLVATVQVQVLSIVSFAHQGQFVG